MNNFAIGWIAVVTGHNVEITMGSLVIEAHSEQEAIGAVTEKLTEQFPARRILVSANNANPVPWGNLGWIKI